MVTSNEFETDLYDFYGAAVADNRVFIVLGSAYTLAKLATNVILLRHNVYQHLVVMMCESSYPVTFG